MDLCGEAVFHKTFGAGRIVGFVNHYMTVLFDGSNVERTFVYPSAFGAFLEIKNKVLLDQIQVDKDLIAQEESRKNKQISEAFARPAVPVVPKKSPKPKKAPIKKPSV